MPSAYGAAGPAIDRWAGDGPFIDIGMLAADGNANWDSYLYDGVLGGGPYVYGSFSTSVLGAAPSAGGPKQYSERWWWRDFGAGGSWDVRVIHTLGFDVGIYSFRIDDREFARLDGWTGGADINNVEVTVRSGLRIPAGRHKFSIMIIGANTGATGLLFYPAMSAVFFRKVAPLSTRGSFPEPGGYRTGPAVVNIMPWASTGNTNWDTPQGTAAMANCYELYSTGAQNAARWWDIELAGGLWTLDLMVATFSSAGIINVQLDGVTVGTIDTYSSSTAYGVRKTLAILVPTHGRHRLNFLMATKNGSSSNYYGDISNIQLRQVTPGRSAARRIIDFTLFWAHGDTNWSTFFLSASYLYGGDVESTGVQNAERWWYVSLDAGTWDFSLLHATGSNRGIYSVRLDGTQVGTIDGYGGVGLNTRSAITGIVIPRPGQYKLSLVMASKNASSSNYYGTATAIQLRRT